MNQPDERQVRMDLAALYNTAVRIRDRAEVLDELSEKTAFGREESRTLIGLWETLAKAADTIEDCTKDLAELLDVADVGDWE